jgi:rubrerythrin
MLSTFALVFLAELGDKTQLTAMAASAGGKSVISVFIGASAALVLSTLIAVLVGSLLQKFIPEKALKIGASALFLIFGVILMISAFMPKGKEIISAPVERQGVFVDAILESALYFEEISIEDYRSLALSVSDPELKNLLSEIADEEKSHIEKIRDIIHGRDMSKHSISVDKKVSVLDIKPASLETRNIILKAIEHEQSSVKFYRMLAKSIRIPSVKSALLSLAREEESHLVRLQSRLT